MSRSMRLPALNIIASVMGLLAYLLVVVRPLFALVRYGLRPHGPFPEDFDFYFAVATQIVWQGGALLGLTFCILGMSLAIGTGLGFLVKPAVRLRVRQTFWYVPVFCFGGEMLGRYLVQAWFAVHGLIFPEFAFLRAMVPHFVWFVGVWLLTAPAVMLGKGIYLVSAKDLRSLLKLDSAARK